MVKERNLLGRICDFKNLFFKHDEFLKLPKRAKKLWVLNLVFDFLEEVIYQMPAVVLALATSLITQNVVLAVSLLIIWVLFNPIGTALRNLTKLNFDVLKRYINENIICISNNILNYTRDKVEIQKDGINQTMPGVIILNSVSEYLTKFLKCRDGVINSVFNNLLFLFTFASLIQLAKEQVENTFVLYLIVGLVILFSIILQSKRIKHTENYHVVSRPLDDDIENAKRDLQEVEPMSAKHSNFMLNHLSVAQAKKLKITLSELKKKSLDEVLVSFVNSLGVVVMVLFMCLEKGVSGLTPERFLNAVAISQLFSRIVSSIGLQIRRMFNLFDDQMEYEKYEEDYKKIIEVYHENVKVKERPYQNDTLVVKPFLHTYSLTNFHLASKEYIKLKRGDLTLLKGDSGVGKSTLVKILAGDIKVNDSSEKLISVRYFNDESKLGSGNLLEEITLEPSENVDCNKLVEIILGIQLGNKFKTVDSLSKVSCKELSNGLLQRALIARTLYNLGNSDLVCIDEPIGSLDVNNARKVVEFIKEYCNRDKKRFILICTHQYSLIKDMIDKTYDIIAIDNSNSKVVG